MTDSHTLLASYARTGSESAFRELVSRYLDLVYSTAYRLVGGDAESAQDVAQTVFLALANKAGTLPKDVMLGGWLHQHTRFVAGELMRTERRRQLRERQAAEMNAIEDHSESNLAQVAPVLDEAIGQLDAEDRTAILLRFFERNDFRSVGEAIGSSEDAARKRVDRALDKLHVLLKHRGATLSAAGLGTALATEAVTAAPVGLAGNVAGAALASAAAGTAMNLGILKSMTLAKLTLGIAGVVLAGVLAAFLFRERQHSLGMSYSVKGTFSIQAFDLTKEEGPLPRGMHPSEFEVLLDDSAWKIRVVKVGNTNFDSFIASYDRTNKLQYFILARSRPTDDPMPSVNVEASPIPTSGSDFEYPWLAFASGYYFKGQTNNSALSFEDLRSRSGLVRRYEVPCHVALSAFPPYLPTAVDYVSTNWATYLEDDGTLSFLPLPESFRERGYTSAEFRSSGFTNVHGLSFPTSFDYRCYMLKPDAKATNDLSCVLRVRGKVTSISTTTLRVDSALPARRYMVWDLRAPARQVLYPISDGRIPAVDSAIVKAGHVHGIKRDP